MLAAPGQKRENRLVTQPDPGLEPARALLARIASAEVRKRVQKTLVLWELGYLREALSGFRVAAEEALRRIVRSGALEGTHRVELERELDAGQPAKLVDRLYRDREVIPARVALHLHTLLAWGNYASHHQRRGHHARACDLAVLLTIAVDLEEWIATEAEGGSSIFEAPPGEVLELLEARCLEAGLEGGVARVLATALGISLTVEADRVQAQALSLELRFRPPLRAPSSEEPYRGLSAFEPEDAARFHGRSSLREQLLDRVDTRGLTVVSGASGSGKTSLIRAGLSPSLLELGCGVLYLSDYSERAVGLVEQIVATYTARPLIVVLDAFERSLLPELAEEVRRRLLALAFESGGERSGLRVVVGIREDYLGRLLREAQAIGQARVLSEGDALFMVGPLEVADLRGAILKPLEGISPPTTIDPRFLDERLLPDLQEGVLGAVPAKLQIVCGRLYQEARSEARSRIDAELYGRLGGAERILAGHLEQTLASATYKETRDLARALLRALTGTGPSRWLDAGELWRALLGQGLEADAVAIAEVLDRLVDDRLVVRRGGPRGEGAEVALMHDQIAAEARRWTSPAELERELAQDHLDRALAVYSDPARSEPLRGRSLRLVEKHWAALRRPPPSLELLRGSRRARRAWRLAVGLLLLSAAVGLAFGGVQLLRAARERGRAQSAADQGVLLQAQLALEHDPTLSVAWLRNLSSSARGVGALTLLEEARRRGVSVVLRGHEELVTSVVFSADGGQLISASRDGSLRRWDLNGRSPLGPPVRPHGEFVNRVARSPGGALLASAGSDPVVRLWRAKDGAALGELRGHLGPVYALAFSPDGERLASAGDDATIRIWTLSSRRPLATLLGHRGQVVALCFLDRERLASVGIDGTVRIWDVGRGEPLGAPAAGHPGGAYALACTPDGRELVSGGRDGSVRRWQVIREADRPSGSPPSSSQLRPLAPLLENGEWVLAAAISPDGQSVAIAGAARGITIWSLASGRSEGSPLRGHLGFVHDLAFSPDGARLASGSRDGSVRIWDLAGRERPGMRLRGHTAEVRAVAFSPRSATLASASRDGELRIWDLNTRRVRQRARVLSGGVRALAFSPDGDVLAASGEQRALALCEVGGGDLRPRALEVGPGSPFRALAFSPDGTLRTVDGGGVVQRWDRRGRALGAVSLGTALQAAVFEPGGLRLAAAGRDRSLTRWELDPGRRIGPIRESHALPLSLAVGPAVLVAGDSEGAIGIVDEAGVSAPLRGHRHWVLALAISLDGGRLASGSADATVRLWDLRARRPIGPTLLGHQDWVEALAFSPDGKILASASADRTVWLWRFSGIEEELAKLEQTVDQLTNLRVDPDGRVELGTERGPSLR
jgi:WD40 repeat protein